ncbi:MAG TPA: hypothetical protein VFA10_28195 [Ktedonobacteraceae bacterium]|nr:hypothetical protein [Ktedonobacteraceae bacterium]
MTEEPEQQNINDIQRLHFELFRLVRFNLLDGERVVRDLLDWRDLWYSVLPTRFPYFFSRQDDKQYHPYTELSMLRCTCWGYWLADTLYIWTNDEALPHLRQRIEERWEASEIEVISPEDEEMHLMNLDNEHDRVLFVWWD